MSRRIVSFIVLVILSLTGLAAAQDTTPRNYVIAVQGSELSENGEAVNVYCQIKNEGGDALDETTIRLVDLAQQTSYASARLRPLQSGDEEDITLSFDVGLFEPGSRQPFRIQIISGSTSVATQDITIEMPRAAPKGVVEITGESIEIPVLGINIDLTDPLQVALTIGLGGAALIVLLIGLIILRLLFRRHPTFGTWQPPYANIPAMNPDTIAGRRQLWQQHAQNGALTGRCNMGDLQARKLLLGMDNAPLSGWKIIALRMSQYDMYGRVARSQILAPKGLVKRLDKLARKSGSLDHERAVKRVRPVAKSLAGQFSKRLNQRNAMLPIALDLRFQGAHGDVRIVFELYYCQQGHWDRIDQWEPEMTVLSKTIYDSYTFTLYGQSGGETLKEFRQRLRQDLTQVLAEMVSAKTGSSSTLPDTLTSNQPVNNGVLSADTES